MNPSARRQIGFPAGGQLNSRDSKTVVGLAQEFDVLDIRRDFGWQRRLRVGLGEVVEAERPEEWLDLPNPNEEVTCRHVSDSGT